MKVLYVGSNGTAIAEPLIAAKVWGASCRGDLQMQAAGAPQLRATIPHAHCVLERFARALALDCAAQAQAPHRVCAYLESADPGLHRAALQWCTEQARAAAQPMADGGKGAAVRTIAVWCHRPSSASAWGVAWESRRARTIRSAQAVHSKPTVREQWEINRTLVYKDNHHLHSLLLRDLLGGAPAPDSHSIGECVVWLRGAHQVHALAWCDLHTEHLTGVLFNYADQLCRQILSAHVCAHQLQLQGVA